jgi:phosphomevalonate kinase
MTDTTVACSAPGKIILIGEYAVLEGGPSYVRAVDVRARVRIEPRPEGFLLEAPDVKVPTVDFSLDPKGSVIWGRPEHAADPVPAELGLAGAVLSEAFGEMSLPSPCRIRLDTSEFFCATTRGGRGKLGLGSSAALTVALYAAVLRWARAEQKAASHPGGLLARLQTLHRSHQRGRGSGLDVAASLHGGTFVYRRGSPVPELIPLPLPPGLELLCVWSGRSASTGGFLERLAAWRRRNEQAYARYMRELARIAELGIQAAASGDARGFCEALREYARSLDNLGAAASLPIVSPVHRRIGRLAAKHGLTYKPSGAGGGDIGIALGNELRTTQRFREDLKNEGFLVLDCPEASDGLRYEPTSQDRS